MRSKEWESWTLPRSLSCISRVSLHRSKSALEKKRQSQEDPPARGVTQGLIRSKLQDGPLTSGELVSQMSKTTSAQAVYVALSTMRQQGLVETRVDDADGIRKNFLKE